MTPSLLTSIALNNWSTGASAWATTALAQATSLGLAGAPAFCAHHESASSTYHVFPSPGEAACVGAARWRLF
eukprot:CAMPEP_0180779666 /NCGR_PEP_ID=MMETSP1038_2-20121128/46543_1 /TAXON_ID=632150 /ORGANISM="Azadinium spinosum, Strain 3D9" /LENGTH=71 /DNA_ID=CAMNT_0022815045 /DNA_START=67 /DNA_END=279 /DNA_ORIENTATION=+